MEYVLLAFIVIIFVILIVFYNSIFSHHNAVKRAWSDVLAQERQRGRIIPELERVLQEHKAYESGVQETIAQLRARLDNLNEQKIDPKAQDGLFAAHKKLTEDIRLTVENYPDLKASESFTQYMVEITNQEANVGAAMRIFNRNVADFNSLIQGFPGNVINSKFNKKKVIEEFSDSQAAESFEYKPHFD